jgi:hypothetical protein
MRRIGESDMETKKLEARADAMLEFITALADAGNEAAIEFLNKMYAGTFDKEKTK